MAKSFMEIDLDTLVAMDSASCSVEMGRGAGVPNLIPPLGLEVVWLVHCCPVSPEAMLTLVPHWLTDARFSNNGKQFMFLVCLPSSIWETLILQISPL